MGGWYFCAFAVSTYDGAEISTQKGHKSDALALLATMVLVLRSSQPVSDTDAQAYTSSNNFPVLPTLAAVERVYSLDAEM